MGGGIGPHNIANLKMRELFENGRANLGLVLHLQFLDFADSSSNEPEMSTFELELMPTKPRPTFFVHRIWDFLSKFPLNCPLVLQL